MTELMWLRRDLRLSDHPALTAALDRGPTTLLFVLDPVLWKSAGAVRRAWLAANLRWLGEQTHVTVLTGDPVSVVPRFAQEIGAERVHVSREFTPYAARRDRAVAEALSRADVEAVPTGSAYAVDPGEVRNGSGKPYRVFTPFSKAWMEHGWGDPVPRPKPLRVERVDGHTQAESMLDTALENAPLDLPKAGEDAALERWHDFLEHDLADYDTARDRPAVPGTSRLSPYLHLGVVHPRTLLADLASRRSESARRYRLELGWREFYADVLWANPESAWSDLTPLGVAYDDPGPELDAWREGRTGFPIVDAGMRQLNESGWMHNRVRMITASFLTKDLHVWWPHGARYFLERLLDGDVASNNHGWQWVAGTGTDASPYFRIFNPVTQGLRFDPTGDYVRRWVPELADLPGKKAHEPWKHGGAAGYPDPIVDHADERTEALRRYDAARGR
jgi:deoxyribodipyrimidine photo-lyase